MKEKSGYQHILNEIKGNRCVFLDGAIATELQRSGAKGFELSDDTHWGFDALYMSPDIVRDIYFRYLDAGAQILTTNTYSILDAPDYTADYDLQVEKPVHWMDLARKAIQIPRQAIAERGLESTTALAFSIGGEIETDAQMITVELIVNKIFRETPPDLVLFESLSLLSDNRTLAVISMLIEAGIPVWTSFRRCRKGVCGIHGQLWGGPEGDRFGRLAMSLESMGVDALLINCLPVHRIPGTLPWLRDFTSLPLGVYPNVGRYVESGWFFDKAMAPERFAELALEWREEGASIIGGCCGTGPAEIAEVTRLLESSPQPTSVRKSDGDRTEPFPVQTEPPDSGAFWKDEAGRPLFPLPLPEITVDPGVFVPTQGSYLIWKHLFNHRIGAELNCLDVGCGVGILAIQLALNGASHVTALDIQKEAVDNTLTNAYRNRVADRMTGVTADLYSFVPERKYDLVVASLYQMPTDPRGMMHGHRDIDYWGRNLLDHFIRSLDEYLAEEGVAYLMQVSMLGAKQTGDLLARSGLEARVVDFNLYQFNPVFRENLSQIEAVEKLSDAYHFHFREGEDTMVMYLLEIVRSRK